VVSEAKTTKLEAAIDQAISGGGLEALFDVLSRNSNLPGTRPNLEFARTAGLLIASHRGKADPLMRTLLAMAAPTSLSGEYPIIVAAAAFAERALAGVDARGSMEALHDLAGDSRRLIRIGVIAALRRVLFEKGDEALRDLATWTDGYLHAHVVLEALADRSVLDKLHSPEELLLRLDEAFVLADKSPRAAERSQGLRSLREHFPAEVAVMSARFSEVLTWLSGKTSVSRPETRAVVEATIAELRRAGLKNAEAMRLFGALEASAKPARDAARIVSGTRKRSKGRR